MSVKKWIGFALAAAVIITAGILIVTAGLMKWRKQVNYPPDSSAITARGTIEFHVLQEKKPVSQPTEEHSLSGDDYISLDAAEQVNGFLHFQDVLGRNSTSISDISLHMPHDMAGGTIHRTQVKSPKIDKENPLFLYLGNYRLVRFVCSTVPVPIQMEKDAPIVYSCGFSVEGIPGQHGFIHEAAQAFIHDAGSMGISIRMTFIPDSTAETGMQQYIVSHCTLNIL